MPLEVVVDEGGCDTLPAQENEGGAKGAGDDDGDGGVCSARTVPRHP